MPIPATKPKAQPAEERYQDGEVSINSARNFKRKHGLNVGSRGLMIDNPSLITVQENVGFLPTLLGVNPAEITRITGTNITGRPDTVYVEVPKHGFNVLTDPRVARKGDSDYSTMQRRFNTAVGVSRKQQGGTVQQTSQQQDKMKQELKIILAAFVGGDETQKQQAQQIVEKLMQENPQGFYQMLSMLESEGDENASRVKQMIDQQTRSAKQGAKLNYVKELKGICPEGYLKTGGRCRPCEAKMKAKGGDMDPVKSFKDGRKCKK